MDGAWSNGDVCAFHKRDNSPNYRRSCICVKKPNPGRPRARLSHCHHALHPPGTDSWYPAARQRPPRARGVLLALFGTVSSVGTLGPVRFAWALIALLASARQQRPLLPHEDLPHTHKPRDFTTRDDVEKKHRAPEPRFSPTLQVRPQRATPSAPKAVLPRPLRTSGTSRECDLLLAQPFPLMHGTASNPWTTRDGLRWRAKACSSWLWLSRHFGQTRDARSP